MNEGDLVVFSITKPDNKGLYPERVVHQLKAIGNCDGYPAVCLQVGSDIEIHHASQIKVITKDLVKFDPPREEEPQEEEEMI